MKKVTAVLLLITLGTNSLAQAGQRPALSPLVPPARQRTIDLPAPRRGFRPKLTLQRALKIAEEYIERGRIDISPYYLYQAKYMLYAGGGRQEPCWLFWWVKENGAAGDYVEIIVLIETGSAKRLPSM